LLRFSTLCAAALMATSAAAQPSAADRGRLHFQAGASYYEAGDYEDALREFQRSYELSNKPELFYNFSLCHQQLGNLEQAADFLEQYLQNVSEIPNRANLERRLENFRERLAEEGDDDEAPDETDPDETDPDETIVVGPQPDPEPEGSDINLGAIVSFSVAGAGAATMLIAGAMALGERSNLEDMGCGDTVACDAGSLKTRALVADLGMAIAVVGAALGVVFLVVGGGSDDEESARVELSPWAGRGAGGASLRGSF